MEFLQQLFLGSFSVNFCAGITVVLKMFRGMFVGNGYGLTQRPATPCQHW